MKIRKKKKVKEEHKGKPAAILSADWHIRAGTPICRTDDFWTAQWSKVIEVFKLADRYKIPIIIAGDVGHRPQWPDHLESKFVEIFNAFGCPHIYCIPGQHDLPNHNLENIDKSAFHLMKIVGCFRSSFPVSREFFQLHGFPYGKKLKKPLKAESGLKQVAIWHHMVIGDRKLWPGQVADTARHILKKNPFFDLIVTGDNHLPFVEKIGDMLLVNPGSLTRQTAAQYDHKPRVYLWYPESMTVEPFFFPVKQSDVTREHIIEKKSVDERLRVFVKSLQSHQEVGLSFEKNLYKFIQDNRISKKVEEKVYNALED